MQRIIKNRQFIQDNTQHLGLDAPLPFSPCTVPLARWLGEREELRRHPSEVGVRLSATDEVSELVQDFTGLQLIALEFARFTDGRSYSQARLLRERYNYHGELRAVGSVLRDQLQLMERCGIDAFELIEANENTLSAFKEINVFYQPNFPPAIIRRLRQRSLVGAVG